MALSIVEKSLKEQGIQTDWFWIGNKPLTGCIGCGYCAKKVFYGPGLFCRSLCGYEAV